MVKSNALFGATVAACVVAVVSFYLHGPTQDGSGIGGLPGSTPAEVVVLSSGTVEEDVLSGEAGDEATDGLKTIEGIESSRVDVGALMDPNDPSTWTEANEVIINVGEEMDPNDVSTWQETSTAQFNVGVSMDPNDDSTWIEQDYLPMNVGELIDPNDADTWHSTDVNPMNVGAPADPNDLGSWSDN